MSTNEKLNFIFAFSWSCDHILEMICSGKVVRGATKNHLDSTQEDYQRKNQEDICAKGLKQQKRKKPSIIKIKATRNSRENIEH